MTANLNRPAIRPGKLTAADFRTGSTVYQTTQPAEAATEVGLDLDGDGDSYHPMPLAPLLRGLAVAGLLLALATCIAFASELAALGARLMGGL